MNALAIILLLAVPALMLATGEVIKRLVIGRLAGERRRSPVGIPVRESPAADTRVTRVA